MLLDKLRKAGYNVNARHSRIYDDWEWTESIMNKKMNAIEKLDELCFPKRDAKERGWSNPNAHGGITEVFIKSSEGTLLAEGLSYCSLKDNFSRKTGFVKALGRAISKVFCHTDLERFLNDN